MAQHTRTFNFLTLPAELRLRVYEFFEPDVIHIDRARDAKRRITKVLKLMHVNRLLRFEATDHYFRTISFWVDDPGRFLEVCDDTAIDAIRNLHLDGVYYDPNGYFELDLASRLFMHFPKTAALLNLTGRANIRKVTLDAPYPRWRESWDEPTGVRDIWSFRKLDSFDIVNRTKQIWIARTFDRVFDASDRKKYDDVLEELEQDIRKHVLA